jgi:hypothetical protein
MTGYVQLGEKAWNSVTDRHGRVTGVCSKDTHEFLEYQLQQWQNSLPENLRPPPHRAPDIDGKEENRSTRCMRILLHLRANQMLILCLRPLLFSQAGFTANKDRVSRVCEVARDSVRVLSRLDATSDIYRKQQVIFNHFLASTLVVFSLILAHEPRQRQKRADGSDNGDSTMSLFASAREEIYLALELVRSYSTFSSSSRRLWKTFGTLKELLSRLGLLKRDNRKEKQNLTTVPEIEFSELFEILGDEGQTYPTVHTLISQGFAEPTHNLPLPNSWQAPSSLDFREQWNDISTIAGMSNLPAEDYQDYSWTFHGFL